MKTNKLGFIEKVFEMLEMIFDDEISVSVLVNYEAGEPELLLVSVIRNMLNLKINSGTITAKEVLEVVVELKRVLTDDEGSVADFYEFFLTSNNEKIKVATSILEEIKAFLEMGIENKDDEIGGVDNEVS